jgi:hypothetical protein
MTEDVMTAAEVNLHRMLGSALLMRTGVAILGKAKRADVIVASE